MLRFTLVALSVAWLAASIALARQLSQSSQYCVAPYSNHDYSGIPCIGVAERDAKDCKDSFAVYQGQQLPYVLASSQNSDDSYCLVLYGDPCQQVVTELIQYDFSECDETTTQAVDNVIDEAIAEGSVEGSASGKADAAGNGAVIRAHELRKL